ncbi:hypothetical protein NDU88_005026 [Pleurodeles waltl]|uniref:Uncharacterized protein n=1 Tax=Pleurodeles waltl TaxID=8319 RepID=A0AAV7VM11_PLEWA|nr:hypothetical protein NDU88_005026 [Pleurodeles waltl]
MVGVPGCDMGGRDSVAAPVNPQDQQAAPVLADPLASAFAPDVAGASQVPIQTAHRSVAVPTASGLPVVSSVAANSREVMPQEVVLHLASISLWISEVGMLSASLVSGPLAGAGGSDVMEKAHRLFSHLNSSEGAQVSPRGALEGANSDHVKEANLPALASMATPMQAIAAQQPAKVSAVASTSVASSSVQTVADSGTRHLSHLLDLGDNRSEHGCLGLHAPMEVNENIWKGVYIDIFDLLVERSERDKVTRCKECAHARECGHWPHKKKVEESLNNWVRVFSIY